MRWPWRRHCDRAAIAEARRELAESQERLAEARRLGVEVTEVADALRELRRRNNFGPMITDALRGGS
jgi:hypothetical protein